MRFEKDLFCCGLLNKILENFNLEIFLFQGIRICVILGAVGTCIGAWVKVLSVAPDRFYITFIGQTIVAISQTFVLSLPARVAAVWFGQNEVSSACSIGVFGNQVNKLFLNILKSRETLISCASHVPSVMSF